MSLNIFEFFYDFAELNELQYRKNWHSNKKVGHITFFAKTQDVALFSRIRINIYFCDIVLSKSLKKWLPAVSNCGEVLKKIPLQYLLTEIENILTHYPGSGRLELWKIRSKISLDCPFKYDPERWDESYWYSILNGYNIHYSSIEIT